MPVEKTLRDPEHENVQSAVVDSVNETGDQDDMKPPKSPRELTFCEHGIEVRPRQRRPLGESLTRGVPIVGFTGINGAGKTLLLVLCCIIDMSNGRDVYSTVPIHSAYGCSKPIHSLEQLLHLRNATVALDEVAVILSARSTASLPAEITMFLQVLRHRGLTLYWSAPEWKRCDNMLRGVTQGLVNVIPVWRVRDGASPWPRPRLVMAGLMDTSTGKADETPTRVLRRRFYRPGALASFGAYDTLADTPMLGVGGAAGTCVACHGSKERPKHSQARHEALGLPWYPDEPKTIPGSDNSPGNGKQLKLESGAAFRDLGEPSNVAFHSTEPHT